MGRTSTLVGNYALQIQTTVWDWIEEEVVGLENIFALDVSLQVVQDTEQCASPSVVSSRTQVIPS